MFAVGRSTAPRVLCRPNFVVSDSPVELSPDAVDPAALEGLRAFGGVPLLTQLVRLYREQVSVRLSAMDAAIRTGDPEGLRQAAHALKGSSAQVGAVGLSSLCGRIERDAAHGSLAGAVPLRAELTSAVAAVDQWLVGRGFPV
jgi:two-component system, sensor histidine kinase and response regulator